MRPRVDAFLADPEAQQLGIYIVSAFRSLDLQRQLFADAVKKYGSEQAAGKWVAPPGRSNHGPTLDDAGNKVTDQASDGRWGSAIDVGIPGYTAVSGQWPNDIEARVNAIAARHGLQSPMDWEDWHFEPDPSWAPPAPTPQEEIVGTKTVTVTTDPATGKGGPVAVPGVTPDKAFSWGALTQDDGSVAKVGLNPTHALDGTVQVNVDLGVPTTLAPVEVKVVVGFNA